MPAEVRRCEVNFEPQTGSFYKHQKVPQTLNKPTPLILALLLINTGCNPHKMHLTITDTLPVEGIPSGSGLQKWGTNYYIVGDDAPFLFCLDRTFKITSKIPLLDTLPFSAGRIQKSEKPDFEAMEWIDGKELVVFGSGSKSPQRDLFLRVLPGDSPQVEKYALTNFYRHLKGLPALKDAELNIEAVAYHNNQLFLFNRKPGAIICFEYSAFLNYLKGISPLPKLQVTPFSLPKIGGTEAGFSGATVLKSVSKIIFTATAEATRNAYDDGEIKGSLVGLMDLKNGGVGNTFSYALIPNTGAALKVESVTVAEETAGNSAKLVFVTDDDRGHSVILKGVLRW